MITFKNIHKIALITPEIREKKDKVKSVYT